MDDFLDRMFVLTQSRDRIPREDFLTLCLGHQLERDSELAWRIIGRIRRQLPRADAERLVEREPVQVRAQVPARTGKSSGRADLELRLPAARVCIVIEAKVGNAVPQSEQLERYREALGAMTVMCLVQERVRGACPPGYPVLTWDEIAKDVQDNTALADFRHLLARSWVADTRLCAERAAWSRAMKMVKSLDKLRAPLEKCLVALGPNADVRDAIAAALEEENQRTEASLGWGPGIWCAKPLPGTALEGLCLTVDAGDYPDEVVWRVEARISSKALRKAVEADEESTWDYMRDVGDDGWYETKVYRSMGDRSLAKADLEEVVRNARTALRELHHNVEGRAWTTHGPGTAPHAPKQLMIPDLRAGIHAWEIVYEALSYSARDVLHRLVPDDPTPYRWHDDSWRTSPKYFGGTRVRVGVDLYLRHVFAAVENPSAVVLERLREAVDDEARGWPQLRMPSDRRVEVVLDADGWQDPALVTRLVRILGKAVA